MAGTDDKTPPTLREGSELCSGCDTPEACRKEGACLDDVCIPPVVLDGLKLAFPDAFCGECGNGRRVCICKPVKKEAESNG